MHKTIIPRWTLFTISLIFSALCAQQVVKRDVSIFSLFFWFGAIISAFYALLPIRQSTNLIRHKKMWTSESLIIGLITIIHVSALWYFGSQPAHYHQDEFITAYTSWTIPLWNRIDWFGVYPPIWVSQFPILFHIFQKIFFLIFGPSVLSVRISIWPYAVGILWYTYVLGTILSTRKTALMGTLLTAFFAPQLYLSSMGLHFISSAFFYMATITHWLLFMKTQKQIHSLVTGIFLALSYLTYTGSYVSLPVILLIAAISWGYASQKRVVVMGFFRCLFMASIVLLPFLTYAAFVNNFFVQRVNQVNILWGSWSDVAKTYTPLPTMLINQTVTAVASLFSPGIGGIGGYNFGKMSLFDPMTGALIIAGVLLCAWQSTKKRLVPAALLIAILVPFLANFVLTTHPPPFHRISLLYPLFGLMAGYTLEQFQKILKHTTNTFVLVGVILTICIAINLNRTREMIEKDATLYPQNSRAVADYIMKTVAPGNTIFIAAYPSFYLGQELLFRTNNRYIFDTTTTETIMNVYNGNFLVLFSPSAEIVDKLTRQYPDHKILTRIGDISLGDLTVFSPH
jgi:hypothetical protein